MLLRTNALPQTGAAQSRNQQPKITPAHACGPHKSTAFPHSRSPCSPQDVRTRSAAMDVEAVPSKKATVSTISGHSSLNHRLGDVGEVSPTHLPWLLRLSFIKAKAGGDSRQALQDTSRGLMTWKAALDRGLIPDDIVIQQIIDDGEDFTSGRSVAELRWPEDPLHSMLVRVLSKLGIARYAKKYPGLKDALLKGILQMVCRYNQALIGEEEVVEEREKDAEGNEYKTAAELAADEKQKRATVAEKTADALRAAPGQQLDARRAAVELVKELYFKWQAPITTLSSAGKAFEGLEALLGGGTSGSFDLQMDELRRKLESLKELRDLVRSLGRGGGWGPLRRAPVQYLDFSGRPGLLRTVLEAQETRGLTRSDDISRLLPAEQAMMARGKTVRQAKLLFYARLAEKALQSYERDGWGEFPTNIKIERREVRPTADRGPILLCVDTSGSMRGARETVAKALALECMRAAKEQERQCFVYAFSGPNEVRELELNMDMKSVTNLLEFLETKFNGGSDFNEPVKRCLERLTDAKWANSDILLVSDGELRQPAVEIMRKLSGAKDKLSLRVHGLIIGAPEKKKADPAVLRSLCTNYLPNGKIETLISEFSDWKSVQADDTFNLDWDDVEGNQKRRLAGLKREKARQEAMRTLRVQTKASDRRSSVSSNDKNLKAMGLGSGATPGGKSKKF
eukprot:gene11915-15016_t